jgi:hypothetical protein
VTGDGSGSSPAANVAVRFGVRSLPGDKLKGVDALPDIA